MANFVPKQSSNYPNIYQVLQYNSATCFSTKFNSQTQQIRVLSQLAGWATVNQTTADVTIATSAGGVGMVIAANTAQGDYFTVRPGQIFVFSSTSTATGAVSVTEMA